MSMDVKEPKLSSSEAPARRLPIDMAYAVRILKLLLDTPSPTGHTDDIVRVTCRELERLGIPFELTRRGAIRACLRGRHDGLRRAVVAHLDTLGAMVKNLKDNGRLEIVPIGYWSPRFAEGARCTVFSDDGREFRGTILPLKASGHTYNGEIDTQPVAWNNLEVRIDEICHSGDDLRRLGVNVGDHIAIDANPEFGENGFVNSRFLDDSVGVTAMLAAAKAVVDGDANLPVGCNLVFTISEEVGVGASHVLHGDVSELVAVDNGTIAPGQNTCEYGVTIAMQDMSGPFDRHLTRRLIGLCQEFDIEHSREVFIHYRSDGAAAVEAGNDIRNALLCFALDGSHGYERTHLKSLEALAELLALYMQTAPTFPRDGDALAPRRAFAIDTV